MRLSTCIEDDVRFNLKNREGVTVEALSVKLVKSKTNQVVSAEQCNTANSIAINQVAFVKAY